MTTRTFAGRSGNSSHASSRLPNTITTVPSSCSHTVTFRFTKDNFRKYPSVIREWDHLVGQMIYLARTKRADQMKDKYDMIEMIADISPEQASPPRSLSKCKLQSFAETPVHGG